MNTTAFYILAAATVIPVIMLLLQRNPVSSAVCLVAAFFGLAGLYVLLDAHFVAIIQLLVYAGAIMVLFIFVIMLLNLKEHELVHDQVNKKTVLAVVAGTAFAVMLTLVYLKIPQATEDGKTFNFPPIAAENQAYGTAAEVGRMLYDSGRGYFIPFEIIAILLLVGLVGAVMLGRRE